MRREYRPEPPDAGASESKKHTHPLFKRRAIEHISAKEAVAEAAEYSGGAAGRKEYVGPEGLRKAAREYLLRYAESYLRDYIFSMDEIHGTARKREAYETAFRDLKKLLTDKETETKILESLWGNYELELDQTLYSVISPGVHATLKEILYMLHSEYLTLVQGSYSEKAISIEGKGFQDLYHGSIELKPELQGDTFVIGDIRQVNINRAEPYDKAPIDRTFLKNTFGIEVGGGYFLEPFITRSDNESNSYETLIQEARRVVHARIIDGKKITEEEARLHFPTIPPARLKELLADSMAMRSQFEAESENAVAEGMNKFKELLQAAKSEFIGIRYQERGNSKFIDGGFYPDRTGVHLLQPKGNEMYATPVFGDDLFRVTNISSGRNETNTYLGANLFAREITVSDPTKVPSYYIFGSRVTHQAYTNFLSDVSEIWAGVYDPDGQIVPPDIARITADAERKLNKQAARDAVVGEVVAQIHIIQDSARRQRERLRDDPELAALYEDTSQKNLTVYLDGKDTYVLIRAYIDVWRANVEPEITDTIIRVLKQRKLGDEDLHEIFREATKTPDEWISLRRSLWRNSTDDEFLYSTLFRIIESDSNDLGYSAGPVAVYDEEKKEYISKEYTWGIADIETLLDRIAERHRGRTQEPILSNSQAQKAIETFLANKNNMNPAIVRFLPYVTDQVFLYQLARHWSADAEDDRFCDTPSPVDPFSSVPCRILEHVNQGAARQIMGDPAFSYETRLYALSMRSSLKPADRTIARELLSEPYKKIRHDGRTLDVDRGRSAARVETITRGLLDPYPDILKYLATGQQQIDEQVAQTAQNRLQFLKKGKS